MEAISRIKLDELAPQSSGEASLLIRRGPRLDAATEAVIQRLWMETVAAYPNQVLPPATPDMWLVKWEEMILRFGVSLFRDALSKAVDGKFFPTPDSIKEWCESLAETRRSETDAQKYLREHEEMKAQWERERAEDKANATD